jgi:hypothetical protein
MRESIAERTKTLKVLRDTSRHLPYGFDESELLKRVQLLKNMVIEELELFRFPEFDETPLFPKEVVAHGGVEKFVDHRERTDYFS